MPQLKHLITILSFCFGTLAYANSYTSSLAAQPNTAFEVRYPIEYEAQIIKSGTSYPYKGAAGANYFIEYTFDDGQTHTVPVPGSNAGQPLLEVKGNDVEALLSFKYTFKQASVIFDPHSRYTVIEQRGETLVLAIPESDRQIEAPASSFSLQRVLVANAQPTDSNAPLQHETSDTYTKRLNAYLESHPLSDATPPALERAIQSICIIKSDKGAGTGFFLRMEGRVYCVTNHHVLAACQNLQISTTDGRIFTPLYYEVAEDRDLARIVIEEAPPSFTTISAAELNEKIQVLGNSGGAGVITFDEGKVIGGGTSVFEVNSDFIPGNSGSPVLNEMGAVVGVATYVRRAEKDESDWVAQKTRFTKARRFATQITEDINWIPVNPNRLKQSEVTLSAHHEFINTVTEWILHISTTPTLPIPESGIANLGLRRWADQANANLKHLYQEERNLNPRSTEYNSAKQKLTAQYLQAFNHQIKSLIYLVKRQETQLERNQRALPSIGYYPEEFQQIELQYEYLANRLDYLSNM